MDQESPTLKSVFSEVLSLQQHFNNRNTPEMERRGLLIRDVIPELLSKNTKAILDLTQIELSDFQIQGRDATGNKSEVPWVRMASLSRSPKASEGWYCVYLFNATGKGVYLALGHGTTRWRNGQPSPRSDEELARHISWARDLVRADIERNQRLNYQISLDASRVGKSYEKGCVAAFYYAVDDLPDDEQLVLDASYLMGALDKLYSAQDAGREPGEESNEMRLVNQAVDEATNPLAGPKRKHGRQGYLQSPEIRKCIEMRGMKLAKEYLEGEGFEVRDVSATESCDFRAKRSGITIAVEVKATTGFGHEIILTRNEVNLHRQEFPNNMLIIVSDICIQDRGSGPSASGGKLRVEYPWKIEVLNLEPLSYRYGVNSGHQ